MVIVRVCLKCMATLHYTELSHSGWKPFVRIRLLLGIISLMTAHKDLLLKSLLEVNIYWMTCQLAVEGINDKSGHHLIENLFWVCKISSQWVQYHFIGYEKYHSGFSTALLYCDRANLILELYHNEHAALLHNILALDKSWMWAYDPEWKWQTNMWCQPGCPPGTQHSWSDTDYY